MKYQRKKSIAAIAVATVMTAQSIQPIFALENEKITENEIQQPSIEETTESTNEESEQDTEEVENNEEQNQNEEQEQEQIEENVEEDTEGETDETNNLQEANIEEKAENKKITILHTNDIHGRFVKDDKVIGIDVLASIKKQTPNSILVDAGDTIHGLPFVTLNKGKDAVDLMNAAGYEFMVPGNHDFNYGYERLLELLPKLQLKPGESTLRVLSSNVKKDGQSVFEPSYIKEINGVKVGFFGISSPETAFKTNPNNVKGVEFTSPVESAKKEVENLESQGADVIVGLSHVGVDESSDPTTYDIVNKVDGIDVIVDGHSHTSMPNGKLIKDTLIVSTGDYMSNIGKVELEIAQENGKNKVVKASASHITKTDTKNIAPDEQVLSKVNEIKAKQDVILSKVIGQTKTELDGFRDNVRTKETNLGNLLTDAMINETDADIAITNGGGIRASIKAGEITTGNIVEVLPFGNFIVTKELTGSQIKEILEHGVKDYGKPAGSFAHVGGMKFVVDPSSKVGNRVIDITIDGKKIDMSKKYVVATNDFLAAGGDEYPNFKDAPALNEYNTLQEALSNYIQKLGTLDYKVEGRIKTGKLSDLDDDSKDEDNKKPSTGSGSNGNNNSGSNNNTSNPQTGDTSIFGYIGLGIAAIGGLATNTFRRKRK